MRLVAFIVAITFSTQAAKAECFCFEKEGSKKVECNSQPDEQLLVVCEKTDMNALQAVITDTQFELEVTQAEKKEVEKNLAACKSTNKVLDTCPAPVDPTIPMVVTGAVTGVVTLVLGFLIGVFYAH